MARYAYDVNTTQRYIDVHKQFQGGLKTVDTDDSLGAVFLRQAENVSLSEFGFLEKRYGTYENFKKQFSGNLQGYWEFQNHIIFVVNGIFYVNDTAVPYFHQENTKWRYPENLLEEVTLCNFVEGEPVIVSQETNPEQEPVSCTEGASYYSSCTVRTCSNCENTWSCIPTTASTEKVYTPAFQTNRDMNAVNVNSVLYVFTGTYPIYVKIVQGQPKFYLFSIDIPTYDEIVVTGHNLLENNYEPLYFEDQTELLVDLESINPTSTVNYLTFEEADKASYPKLPYVFDPEADASEKDGKVYFKTGYKYNEVLDGSAQTGTPFTGQEGQDLYVLNLASLQYRSSGPGSSTLDFIEGSKDNVDFVQFSNISGNLEEDLVLADSPVVTKVELTEEELGNDENTLALRIYEEDGSTNFFMRQMDIEKSFNVARSNIDFDKQYGIKFEWIKEPDDPNTADNDAVYELLDFEALKKNVRDAYQTLYDDTTTQYISNSNVNLTTFVKNYYETILNDLNSRFYRIEIIPYNVNGVAFSNTTIIDRFNIDYISARYIFKFPENILQTDEVAGYFVKIILPAYYIRSQVPNPLDLIFDVPEFDFFRFYATSQDNDVVAGSLESMLTVKQGSTKTIGTDIIELSVTSLISGLYDFRFAFDILKYTVEDGFLVKKDAETVFTDVFFNIQITQEKLKDFPRKDEDSIGIEYPSIKPIWTCNKVIEHFGKLMVWGSTEMPTAVFYSFPDRPTYFPSKFYLDFTNDEGAAIENVTSYMNILVAQTADRTWGIRGNSGLIDAPAPYVPFTINPTVGTIAYKSVRPVRNHLFFLSKQGVIALKSLYAADEQYNIEFVDRNIKNIVRQDSQAVGIQYDNQYWLNFPNFGITLRWYIDKKAWVQDVYSAWNDFKGVFKYQIKDGKLEFITNPSVFKEGNNHIYKVGIDYSLPTDLGEIVVGKFETSFLNQNYPFHPKNYKEAKLDFTLQNEYNLSKDVIYFEDNIEINQSHFLDNVSLLKNHRYRIYYYNLPKNLNLSYTVNLYPKLYIENDIIGNQGVPLLTSYSGTLTTPDVDPKEGTQEHIAFLEFLMPNALDGQYDIEIVLDTFFEGIDVDVRDATYDDVLNFLVWLTSENSTLNQDPIQDYGQAKVNNVIPLQDRLGDWEFGQTNFGKKITAVETIKLSGKGYNAKMYMEDYSKSKWTLESLGLTYKMKRARSR